MWEYILNQLKTTNEQRAKFVDSQSRWQHIALFLPVGNFFFANFLVCYFRYYWGVFPARDIIMLEDISKDFVLLREKVCISSVFNGNTIINLYDIHNR